MRVHNCSLSHLYHLTSLPSCVQGVVYTHLWRLHGIIASRQLFGWSKALIMYRSGTGHGDRVSCPNQMLYPETLKLG